MEPEIINERFQIHWWKYMLIIQMPWWFNVRQISKEVTKHKIVWIKFVFHMPRLSSLRHYAKYKWVILKRSLKADPPCILHSLSERKGIFSEYCYILGYTNIAKCDYQFRYANLYDQNNDVYTSTDSLQFRRVSLTLVLPLKSWMPISASAILIICFKYNGFMYKQIRPHRTMKWKITPVQAKAKIDCDRDKLLPIDSK